uniref:Uncharacterized protein n=1 Tax=Sphaerodactylus townsendi TaxID=933632 RepID=A0ACB8FU60_9SAUR
MVHVSKHTAPSPSSSENEQSSLQPSDVQSFAQKLQLRVPSMESLFRSPLKDSLFRSSSKESLVRTSSRDSLNKLDFDSPGPAFDPPSDVESEAEELPGNVDSLPKEQLLQRLRRMERSLGSYRGKYSELVTAFQVLQREKKKLQGILSQSQDKALRRIGELREELQMDQQAKKHLQEEFDASLEEKDQLISVLQTQVSLLKQRLQNGQISIELPEPNVETQPQVQSPTKNVDTENTLQPGSLGAEGDSSKMLENLTQRVKRQENLLHRCKETIRMHKERSAQLTSEKEALQEQLDERLQELEKMKELHMAEKTRLITDLRDAKNSIEQLEQDKGMVIAETKRQMHETLEMKEEEVARLRTRIKQVITQSEELKEQKEKSEKAAIIAIPLTALDTFIAIDIIVCLKSTFEELEKALSAAQRTEEARKKLQVEMDDRIKAVEKASEEERVNLQQELTKVKQQVVNIMKKSSEERVAELEKLHKNELAKKEQAFQEQIKAVLEKCQSKHLQSIHEKEQQESLALEELELQKKAIQLECAKKVEDMQQEVETLKTRILELESSLKKDSQVDKSQLEEMTAQIGSEKNKHNKEVTTSSEKHGEELEFAKQQQEQLWTVKLDTLTRQQQLEMEELKRQKEEVAKMLKEKEAIFHAHIEEMNEKTFEKLDVKQTELEALSSELSEALKIRQTLERDLSALKDDADKAQQDFEAKLEQQRNQHQKQIETIFKDHERAEETFKEEITQLRQLLEVKEKLQVELEMQVKALKESLEKAGTEHNGLSAELEALRLSTTDSVREQTSIYEQQLMALQQKLADANTEKSHLEEQVVKMESQMNELKADLDCQISQVDNLKYQLEEQKRENAQTVTSVTDDYESQLRELREKVDQAMTCFTNKENELEQIKELLNQQINKLEQHLSAKEEEISMLKGEYENKLKHQETQAEKVKEKAKEMHEKFKKKLSEQEAKLKKEIENKQLELSQKEKQFNLKILEMAHASSAGINDAVSKLEMNQKEQLETLAETHRRELEEIVQSWEKKLSQQAEELQEKHELELQEKNQEAGDLKQKLATFSAEREGFSAEIVRLKDEQARKDESLNALQVKLQETLAEVAALTQKVNDLKTQLGKLKDDLGLALKQKETLQEQLSELKAIGEKEKDKVSELVDRLKISEEQLQALESSHFKEREDYEKKIEDTNFELQGEKAAFENLVRHLSIQLEDYQQKAEALLQTKASELTEKFSEKMSSVIAKVAHCHHQATKLKDAILVKTCKIPELEAQLREVTESCDTLSCSLQESKEHLEEKESLVRSMTVDIEQLVAEKEQLQKEGGHQQQAATDKETCITQLKKELSENMNAVTSMREEIDEKKLEIADLNKLVGELNLKLENSSSEKDAAVALLNKQHKENRLQLLNEVQELSSKVDTLSQEKAAALEQVDHWMNKMSEWKKKAQSRFTQNHSTIKELHNKLELSNNQASEKEEELNRMKEELDKQTKNLEHLRGLVDQKQTRKEKQESDLVAERKIHTARIAELEEHITRKTAENDSLMEELKRQNEQNDIKQQDLAHHLQGTQAAIEEKDNSLKEMEQKMLVLEKKIKAAEVDLEAKSREFEQTNSALMKSKVEELKALEERLISETNAKTELKKKAEQRIGSIKKQLTSQMEEREQLYRQELEKQLVDLEQKLQEKENKIKSLEERMKSTDNSAVLEKEMIQKVETMEVSTEQEKMHALESMQQMYELKISFLQNDLLAKEKLLQMYNGEQKTSNTPKLEAQKQLEELLKKNQDDLIKIEKLQQELEEQIKKHDTLLEQHTKDSKDLANIRRELKAKEQKQQETEQVIEDLQKKLQEMEEERQPFQQKISSFDEDLARERELHKAELGKITLEYEEKLQGLQQQVDGKSSLIKTLEENTEEKAQSRVELQKQLDDLKNLQSKLEEAEREKKKLSKDVNKLQKDVRSLRKEHQQELEIVKKESLEEMEQKLKYEQEDAELKHNSTLKQLMREFNTQLAQKEKEVETAVRETISKAQEVEAELIESHHTEITQLYTKMVEKDDDLQRTVKKYEEILEAREEEMTGKVHELQKQLEKLQEEYKQRLADEENWNSGEVTIADLQAQLAQKTTLINDSKLKEQEFTEQIHTLQDRLKKYEKSMYVTTVGTPYRGGNLCHSDVTLFGEPTEFEYLRKVLFEYMMGRETKTMAKVITTVLKFPADQAQKILEREDARTVPEATVGYDIKAASRC